MARKDWLWFDALGLPAWASAASGPLTLSMSAPGATVAVPDKVISLPELASQEEAEIIGFTAGQGAGCHQRLRALGLRPGLALRMLHNPGCGLVLLQVNGSRLALGRGVAAKILVRRRGA